MVRVLISAYFYLLLILLVSFLNIYSVDKYEFKNNKQKCIEFKRKVFFIIMYSKEKRIVSKKTFFLELIGYILLFLIIIICACSVKLKTITAFLILGLISLFVFSFACLIAYFVFKIKRDKDYTGCIL